MTKIESKARSINQSSEVIFNFLSDFNQFEHLMPDKVINWSSSSDTCQFTISGIASLGMKIVEKQPFNRIQMTHFGNVPFNFDFEVQIHAVDQTKSQVQLVMNAELNAMLKMLAVKPLGDFLEKLLDQLETHTF
jgi:carbon monoxide dehydrogenase subunit G